MPVPPCILDLALDSDFDSKLIADLRRHLCIQDGLSSYSWYGLSSDAVPVTIVSRRKFLPSAWKSLISAVLNLFSASLRRVADPDLASGVS